MRSASWKLRSSRSKKDNKKLKMCVQEWKSVAEESKSSAGRYCEEKRKVFQALEEVKSELPCLCIEQHRGYMAESHESPKLNTDEELWFNEDIGYVDTALAVEAVAEEASKLGVSREIKDVTRLTIDERVCIGFEGDHCRVVIDGKTITATGPRTPGLLESSKVEFPNDFFTVARVRYPTRRSSCLYQATGSRPI